MNEQPRSPLEEAAAGAARAAMEAAGEKARDFLKWVAAGKLRFLGNPETIQETKRRKQTPEWEFLRVYLDASDLRTQVLLGLELRDLDALGDRNRLEESRWKLKRRYGDVGLHVAQLAKLGIITDLVNELVKKNESHVNVVSELAEILTQADSRVRFVQAVDHPQTVARTVHSRLETYGTQLLIAKGNARGVLQEALQKLHKGRTRIILDTSSDDSQAYAILFREDMWPDEGEVLGPGRSSGGQSTSRPSRYGPLMRKK